MAATATERPTTRTPARAATHHRSVIIDGVTICYRFAASDYPGGAGCSDRSAEPFMRELPEAAVHLLDTGHFAPDDESDAMLQLIRNVLARRVEYW